METRVSSRKRERERVRALCVVRPFYTHAITSYDDYDVTQGITIEHEQRTGSTYMEEYRQDVGTMGGQMNTGDDPP